MCVSPLRISNPKENKSFYVDPSHLYVPCGHCVECQHAKHLEWFTRAYYEYLDTKRKGGSVLYFTLTYNNNNLPSYNCSPCFSRSDIQKFLKRFRKYFESESVKYFITSEYGGKTHRPHYHGLIYVTQKVLPYTLKRTLAKTWQKGFVHFGKFGGIVNGAGAISYTAKYINKDFEFNTVGVPKEFHPFHLQSRGFGQYIIEHFNLDSVADTSTFNRLVSGEILVDDTLIGQRSVYIPQYVTRKLLYNVYYDETAGRKEHPRWVLNYLGARVKRARYNKEIETSVQRFEKLYNNINSILYDEKRLALFSRHCNQNFATLTEIRRVLDRTDFRELAHYCALYKNLTYVSADFGVDLTPVVDDMLLWSQSSLTYLLDVRFGFRPPEPILNAQLSMCCDLIKPQFEDALGILNALNIVRGTLLQEEDDRKRELYNQLKLTKSYA